MKHQHLHLYISALTLSWRVGTAPCPPPHCSPIRSPSSKPSSSSSCRKISPVTDAPLARPRHRYRRHSADSDGFPKRFRFRRLLFLLLSSSPLVADEGGSSKRVGVKNRKYRNICICIYNMPTWTMNTTLTPVIQSPLWSL